MIENDANARLGAHLLDVGVVDGPAIADELDSNIGQASFLADFILQLGGSFIAVESKGQRTGPRIELDQDLDKLATVVTRLYERRTCAALS